MPKKCKGNRNSSSTRRKHRSSTKASQRRCCLAELPTTFCSPGDKTSKTKKKSSLTKRRNWETEIIIQRVWSWFSSCCGVPKKKDEKRSKKAPVREPVQTNRSVNGGKKICEDQRPVYCCQTSLKPVRKKSENSCSKLFCCSCLNKFWKRSNDKKRASRTAPCKRYLCLHNPGRSEFDEPVPCVKCTHNCRARCIEQGSKKKSKPAKEAIAKPCFERSPETQIHNLKLEDNVREVSDTGIPEFTESRVKKRNKNELEGNCLEDIPYERYCAREKCIREKKKSPKRRKSCKKSKREGLYCLPNTSTTLPSGNNCYPCEAKPCMKCPKKMDCETSCKKLTFASCAELRDYKLRNKGISAGIKKKRTLIDILFDVIFWPYVFWPRKSNPCK